MKRSSWALALVIGLVCAGTVRADSVPIVSGAVSGLELCQQTVCGAAIFVGIFQGRVGNNTHALGTMVVAVHHEPLPEPGYCAKITDGFWQIQTLGRTLNGGTKGTLCANPNNTFLVTVALGISQGTGSVTFTGTLDHNVFPPSIKGLISQ